MEICPHSVPGVRSFERRLLSSVPEPTRQRSRLRGSVRHRRHSRVGIERWGRNLRSTPGTCSHRSPCSGGLAGLGDRPWWVCRRRGVLRARPDERGGPRRPRRAARDRAPRQLDHALVRARRAARLVAAAGEQVRPADDRCRVRQLPGDALVDDERRHVHARAGARPGPAGAVPARLHRLSDGPAGRDVRALARRRGVRDGDRAPARADGVGRVRAAQPARGGVEPARGSRGGAGPAARGQRVLPGSASRSSPLGGSAPAVRSAARSRCSSTRSRSGS